MTRTEHGGFGPPPRTASSSADLDFFAAARPSRCAGASTPGSGAGRVGWTILAPLDDATIDSAGPAPRQLRVARRVIAVGALAVVLVLLGVVRMSDVNGRAHTGQPQPAAAAPTLPTTLLGLPRVERAGLVTLARNAETRNTGRASAGSYRRASAQARPGLRLLVQYTTDADVAGELRAAGVSGRQIFLRKDTCGLDRSRSLVCVRSGKGVLVTVRARLPLRRVAAATDEAWLAETTRAAASS